MLKLLLIRHGETEGNKLKRYIGKRTDEPLCKEAKQMLQELNYEEPEAQKKSDSIVRLYVKIPSIPAASEVPVMNTEQHVQSANYSIQKAARDVLV